MRPPKGAVCSQTEEQTVSSSAAGSRPLTWPVGELAGTRSPDEKFSAFSFTPPESPIWDFVDGNNVLK